MDRLVILVLLLLILIFIRSARYKETFVEEVCADYDTCVSCANKSSCSWCPSSNTCVSVKDNTVCDGQVKDVALCKADPSHEETPGETELNIDMQGNPLYHDQMSNKTPPPMVYLNKNVMYSPETVMANVSDLRNDVQNLKHLIGQ